MPLYGIVPVGTWEQREWERGGIGHPSIPPPLCVHFQPIWSSWLLLWFFSGTRRRNNEGEIDGFSSAMGWNSIGLVKAVKTPLSLPLSALGRNKRGWGRGKNHFHIVGGGLPSFSAYYIHLLLFVTKPSIAPRKAACRLGESAEKKIRATHARIMALTTASITEMYVEGEELEVGNYCQVTADIGRTDGGLLHFFGCSLPLLASLRQHIKWQFCVVLTCLTYVRRTHLAI